MKKKTRRNLQFILSVAIVLCVITCTCVFYGEPNEYMYKLLATLLPLVVFAALMLLVQSFVAINEALAKKWQLSPKELLFYDLYDFSNLPKDRQTKVAFEKIIAKNTQKHKTTNTRVSYLKGSLEKKIDSES
jgi:hypothetical protein